MPFCSPCPCNIHGVGVRAGQGHGWACAFQMRAALLSQHPHLLSCSCEAPACGMASQHRRLRQPGCLCVPGAAGLGACRCTGLPRQLDGVDRDLRHNQASHAH